MRMCAFSFALFESLVSFEGCKTVALNLGLKNRFESLVSFEGCKTYKISSRTVIAFESLVSFEGCKTNFGLQLA